MAETAKPLMPKATAVWMVDNTSLSFEQIAELCGLHLLEVKGIADGDVAQGIRGKDPITGGELTRDEIRRGEEDPSYRLKLAKSKVVLPASKAKKPARYTPTSRRQDRPNAILWLVRNHGELKDSQIIKLIGTTKPTITQIRERTHWNSQNLQPQDPVTLGLCSQIDLDREVQKAAVRVKKELEEHQPPMQPGATLASTAETTGYAPGVGPQPDIDDEHSAPGDVAAEPSEREDEARMLEQLNRMQGHDEPEVEEQPDVTSVFGAASPARPDVAEDAPSPDEVFAETDSPTSDRDDDGADDAATDADFKTDTDTSGTVDPDGENGQPDTDNADRPTNR